MRDKSDREGQKDGQKDRETERMNISERKRERGAQECTFS